MADFANETYGGGDEDGEDDLTHLKGVAIRAAVLPRRWMETTIPSSIPFGCLLPLLLLLSPRPPIPMESPQPDGANQGYRPHRVAVHH